MLGEDKNLKDSEKNSQKDTPSMPAPYEAEGFRSGSYTKTNRLISALYMVTDILDKDEPMRSKLRTLGTEIISDIHMTPPNALSKISQIMSFLGIASDVNIISEMNCSILRKEFLELSESIKTSNDRTRNLNKINLSEFLREEEVIGEDTATLLQSKHKGHTIGHIKSNSMGVLKGHTLMKALSDRAPSFLRNKDSFDILKKERRAQIIAIVKENTAGVTITDIRRKASGSLASFGEKTLQRELVSMVKADVLKKVGEKRWSKYFIK